MSAYLHTRGTIADQFRLPKLFTPFSVLNGNVFHWPKVSV